MRVSRTAARNVRRTPKRFSRLLEAETGAARRRGVNLVPTPSSPPALSLTPAKSGITIAQLSSPFFRPLPPCCPSYSITLSRRHVSIESPFSLARSEKVEKRSGIRSTDDNFPEVAPIRIISCIIHDSLDPTWKLSFHQRANNIGSQADCGIFRRLEKRRPNAETRSFGY